MLLLPYGWVPVAAVALGLLYLFLKFFVFDD